ncbi:MAG: hypothetical protein II796_01750 [Oscillospiraceae bacterium]|nr:hypothetical protein [Oscillospiraceae bacterium]
MNLGLFKFEVKRQLKSIVFWASIIAAIFFAIKSDDMQLFDLPVETDKEAREFIIDKEGGEDNIYKIAALRDCDWSEYEGIRAAEINNIIKENTKGFRFSQLFFKIFATQTLTHLSFFLLLIIPGVLAKDKLNNMDEMLHTKPINSRQYILSKFFGNITLYTLISFLGFVGVGIYQRPKALKVGLEFNFLDISFPFFCYVVPCILFTSSFLFFFSIISKYPVVSIASYFFLVFSPNSTGFIPYFVNSHMAVAGGYDEQLHKLIVPPVNLYYGLGRQGILLAVSIVFMVFVCVIWEKNKDKTSE